MNKNDNQSPDTVLKAWTSPAIVDLDLDTADIEAAAGPANDGDVPTS